MACCIHAAHSGDCRFIVSSWSSVTMALLQWTSMGPLTAAATRPVLCCGLPRRWLPASCALRHAKSS
eukprot:8594445-Lingulodinium_polyedra.AAC.1